MRIVDLALAPAYLTLRVLARLALGPDHCSCGPFRDPYFDTTGARRCAECGMPVVAR